MAKDTLSRAQRIVNAHIIMGEKEKAETGSSIFLMVHKAFANAETFRKAPEHAMAAGYIPTNMDLLFYVCSMPNKKIIKAFYKDMCFFWDGLETTFRGIITIIRSVMALILLSLMPILWPVGYLVLRYSVLSKRNIANIVCQHDRYNLSWHLPSKYIGVTYARETNRAFNFRTSGARRNSNRCRYVPAE